VSITRPIIILHVSISKPIINCHMSCGEHGGSGRPSLAIFNEDIKFFSFSFLTREENFNCRSKLQIQHATGSSSGDITNMHFLHTAVISGPRRSALLLLTIYCPLCSSFHAKQSWKLPFLYNLFCFSSAVFTCKSECPSSLPNCCSVTLLATPTTLCTLQ
jgi:hypothetical protein